MVDENYIYLSDQDLCTLAARGDRTAVETIYKRHYGLLVNYGLKFNPNLQMVQDSIQTLFVGLLCHPSRWNQVEVSVRAWLLVSLRNLILHQNKSDLKNVHFDDLFAFEHPTHDPATETGPDDKQAHRDRNILNALSKLSARQRQAIYLFYVKGLTHSEIGKLLNSNSQSSMNLLSRALDKLRKLLRGFSFLS